MLDWCINNLVIDNPDYIKKVKLGKWIGKTPEKLYLFERVANTLYVPFGCIRDIYSITKGCKWVLDTQNKPTIDVWYNSNIIPYDYQEEAIRAILDRKNGIVVMPCGSGKTQTALEAVARIKKRAIWITHTGDLLKQSMDRAKACFKITDSAIGTITEGKVNIGTHITFATVQTLCKVDLQGLKDIFDVVIVDECHKCVGTPTNMMNFYKCVSALNARYKIGITATPKRADGLDASMFALLGDIISKTDLSRVKSSVVPVKIKFVETGYNPGNLSNAVLRYDGTIDYTGLLKELTESDDRNNAILRTILETFGKINLILSNRIKHLEWFEKKIKEAGYSCVLLSGTDIKGKKRVQVLHELNSAKYKFILATYQLAKEGLDIPNLRNVYLVNPQRDYATVVQSAGRASRKADGKDFGKVYDFVDNFGMLKGMARSRKNHYKKAGYIIE